MFAIDEAIVRADVTIHRRVFCGIARISENQSSSIVMRNVAKFPFDGARFHSWLVHIRIMPWNKNLFVQCSIDNFFFNLK